MGYKGYKKRSKASRDARENQRGGHFDEMFKLPNEDSTLNIFGMKEGDFELRILPPTWDDADHYGLDIYVHFDVGGQRYLCPDAMKVGKCPVCEAQRELARRGNEDAAKKLKPTKRVICWVINRKEEEKGPQLWQMAWSLDKSIVKKAKNKRTGEIYEIDHPEDGRDIYITREGSTMTNTKYDVDDVSDQCAVSDDDGEFDDWLDFVSDNPLTELLNFFSYEHIQERFEGVSDTSNDDDSDDADGDDDEKKPVTRSRRSRRRNQDPQEEAKDDNGEIDDDSAELDGSDDDDDSDVPFDGDDDDAPLEDVDDGQEDEPSPSRTRRSSKSSEKDKSGSKRSSTRTSRSSTSGDNDEEPPRRSLKKKAAAASKKAKRRR